MPLPFPFDYKNPDYVAVFQWRMERIQELRKKPPEFLEALKLYYRDNPGQFIIDWGTTVDPRNVDRGLPALIPFLLFPKQEEWVDWFIARWKGREPGITDKSRETGISHLMTAVAVTMCLFYDGLTAGFGSRKEEYVDETGNPKALLYKARQFLSLLPVEFRGTWHPKKHSSYMRIQFPDTGSLITGEAGDNIGRGDRTSFYFIDESAYIQRPDLVDAALAYTTNCRVDVSTPRGMNNSFARRRHGGKVKTFTIHWRDDPRKDEEWYKKTCDYLDDPILVAQEVDLDYSASIQGIVIPSKWVQAATDAHIKLGFEIAGKKVVGYDVGDKDDKNGACARWGMAVEHVESRTGQGSDIFGSVERVFVLAEMNRTYLVRYDADGLGAGVRGDARIINARRSEKGIRNVEFQPHHG